MPVKHVEFTAVHEVWVYQSIAGQDCSYSDKAAFRKCGSQRFVFVTRPTAVNTQHISFLWAQAELFLTAEDTMPVACLQWVEHVQDMFLNMMSLAGEVASLSFSSGVCAYETNICSGVVVGNLTRNHILEPFLQMHGTRTDSHQLYVHCILYVRTLHSVRTYTAYCTVHQLYVLYTVGTM